MVVVIHQCDNCKQNFKKNNILQGTRYMLQNVVFTCDFCLKKFGCKDKDMHWFVGKRMKNFPINVRKIFIIHIISKDI